MSLSRRIRTMLATTAALSGLLRWRMVQTTSGSHVGGTLPRMSYRSQWHRCRRHRSSTRTRQDQVQRRPTRPGHL
ncbi:hypothetical protein F5H01DRAFT_355803 [Linnemannia elongata]|nr:hypothetical protein F5H01DRAFT_355803 [Linnemannia elongata]